MVHCHDYSPDVVSKLKCDKIIYDHETLFLVTIVQGFLNFFVYIRLKMKMWRDVFPERLWISNLGNLLAGEEIPAAAFAAARRRTYLKNRPHNSTKAVADNSDDEDIGTQRVG